ncbi:divalent-cation tolerance protein CutA [Chiayiivirga flava]|uniref:Periplasmic divalent cation tolerance protein n=1 Tax=Chiayiivirga flava TaxID=659595 RepID=A0A7W8DAG2_9GAMM|nr:divalent-cation tolerance protein CutA [Chiayiivirga flava]MBB5209717.1 periplasmic divalent cation tolerance protein [Chiayiivirga flava]
MTVLFVHCTCPDAAVAERIARSLVEQRLAACVSIGTPVQSIYRWDGAIEQADEVPIVIKTTASRLDEIKVHILLSHPYELPEIVAVEATAGLDRYLGWIRASTEPQSE